MIGLHRCLDSLAYLGGRVGQEGGDEGLLGHEVGERHGGLEAVVVVRLVHHRGAVLDGVQVADHLARVAVEREHLRDGVAQLVVLLPRQEDAVRLVEVL